MVNWASIKKRPRLWRSLLALVLVTFALVQLSQRTAALGAVDRLYSDLWHRVIGARAVPQHTALVIVDDASLDMYPQDPLVFWTPHFAKAIKTLRAVDARVVGLDFMLSISPEDWLRRHGIGAGTKAATFDVPMRTEIASGALVQVASMAQTSTGKTQVILPAAEFVMAVPELDLLSHIGLADLVTDSDGAVREFSIAPVLSDGTEMEGMPALSFSPLLAIRALGRDPAARQWELAGQSYANNSAPHPIRFSGPPGTVPRISFHRLLQNDAATLPEVRALRGRVVIIGGEYHGIDDLHATPYTASMFGKSGQFMSGAEIHANVVETLLAGQTVMPLGALPMTALQATLLLLAAFAFQLFRPLWGLVIFGVLSAKIATLSYLAFKADIVMEVASLQAGLAVLFVGGLVIKYVSEERSRIRIRNTFGHYVSDLLVEEIINSGHAPVLGGETKRITILFSDIRNFTTISERLNAQEVVEILNEFFERACTIVMAEGGTVDKFIGDAIMVQFGAPVPHKDHADRALRAAVAMAAAADELKVWLVERFPGRDLPPFAIGIGLSTGDAVVGNIGSVQRLEYTAIGDAVNAASRIEGKTKELACTILASRDTVEAAVERPRTGRVQSVMVKGKGIPLELHEILGAQSQQQGSEGP